VFAALWPVHWAAAKTVRNRPGISHCGRQHGLIQVCRWEFIFCENEAGETVAHACTRFARPGDPAFEQRAGPADEWRLVQQD